MIFRYCWFSLVLRKARRFWVSLIISESSESPKDA
jgi:hypothetical protein